MASAASASDRSSVSSIPEWITPDRSAPAARSITVFASTPRIPKSTTACASPSTPYLECTSGSTKHVVPDFTISSIDSRMLARASSGSYLPCSGQMCSSRNGRHGTSSAAPRRRVCGVWMWVSISPGMATMPRPARRSAPG